VILENLMAPSDIQEMLEFEPFVPFRLYLADGSVFTIEKRDGAEGI
jgi:hypothetical protein